MIKYLFSLLLPAVVFAQVPENKNEVIEFLTSDTWNISYNITPEGEMMEQENQEKIQASWVKFNKDGSYEMPNEIAGKIRGKWTYNESTKALHFAENGAKYRAIIEEISDMNLLLHYVDNGGFKIGLVHFVYIPKKKSVEEITRILTSGRWNVIRQKFDIIDDKIPAEDVENTWFEFNSDYTYLRSEVIAGDVKTTEGTWFVDDRLQLNLDADEMSIYSVVSDNSRMILTSNTDGIKTIECRKAK